MDWLLSGKLARPEARDAVAARDVRDRVSVIDASLFSQPYDEALVAALIAAGLRAELVGRPLRAGEAAPPVPFRPRFYQRFDAAPRRLGPARAALKAAEHLAGGLALAARAEGLLHFQWLPFPLADALLLRLCRRRGPVVATVHDTTPFNGDPSHPLQARGFAAALAAADRLVVHTAAGRHRIAGLGIAPERIAVVPHGPLGEVLPKRPPPGGRRFALVAFGKIRPYKGLDLLVEALARLEPVARVGLRVIIAGEPMFDLAPLRRRIADARLGETVALVPRRLDDGEMQALLRSADGFVFPYRTIEASGVFFRVQGLGRWVIASRLGAFAEALEDGISGRLVAPGDPVALAAALREAAVARPVPATAPRVTGWDQIARATAAVYDAAWRDWTRERGRAGVAAPATR